MYPGPFKPVPMSFQYPGQQQPQQAPSSLYQSAYGAYNAFVAPVRERSVPASARPNQSANGPYAATPTRRHSKHGRQPPCQHEYCNNHDSKFKRHQRRVCISPIGAMDQSLYSDDMKTSDDLNRSPTPPSKTRLKPDDANINDHDSKVHGYKPINNEMPQGVDETQNLHDYNKRKSRSKRRGHHRHQHPQGPSSSQKRVHIQPLYNSHYQSHEDSSRRDDPYGKSSKRPSRVHPDDNHQMPVGHGDRPYSSAYAPYSPYQAAPHYYSSGTHCHPQAPHAQRSNTNGVNSAFEREIHRLRAHIHALEDELHNLQKKIHKSTLHHVETSTQDDFNLKKHRSKRHVNRSPRQTPVIVEINNVHGEHARDLSPKKQPPPPPPQQQQQQQQQRHPRSSSHANSQQSRSNIHTSHQRQSSKTSERQAKVFNPKAPSQSPKPAEPNPCECSCAILDQISEQEVKPVPIQVAKQPREDTAAQLAQLAHAAAARVQARQHVPPPPSTQQFFTHNQESLSAPGQQIRELNGPHPAPGNYSELNTNQSNNNDLYNNASDRNNRSAEKILDAFERFYKNIGRSSTTPVKVKYIPGEASCNHCQQRNINNNTSACAAPTGLSPISTSSDSSSSDEIMIQECQQKTTYAYT